MRIAFLVFSLGVLIITLTGCKLQTPEIRGVVLDVETKEPVEGAWVTATLEVYSKTVAGDVHQSLLVGKTWTDKEGRFVIPSKEFKKPPFPVSFGSKVESLNIAARTVSSKGYISDGIGIKGLKKEGEISLSLKPPKDEAYYCSAVVGLYDYILSGRLGVSIPPVPEKERLDVLGLAIKTHEEYIEEYSDIKTTERSCSYSNVLKDLGYLYKKSGDYRKALETFNRVKEFDKKYGITLWLKEYEIQINELQQKLQEKQDKRRN